MKFDPLNYERRTFANIGGSLISQIELETIRELLDSVRNGVILDVGMGTGRIVQTLLKLPVVLVGVDRDPKMIHHFAKRKANLSGGGARIDLVVASGDRLPFRSDSFNAVTCVRALRYFDHPNAGVADMCLVLASEGRLVLEFANAFQLRSFLQLPQILVKGKATPHVFRLRTINRLVSSKGIVIDSVHAWHKAPAAILTRINSKVLIRFFLMVELFLQKLTPVELLSRSIVVSGKKTTFNFVTIPQKK